MTFEKEIFFDNISNKEIAKKFEKDLKIHHKILIFNLLI